MRLVRGGLLLPFLLNCSDHSYSRATAEEEFYQAPVNTVDILWITDNSPSMEDEQASLAAGAQNFIDRLLTINIDFHMGVISTDISTQNPDAGALLGTPAVLDATVPDYVHLFQERVKVGTGGDDQEKGLQAAITALTAPKIDVENAGFLREEALLFIAVVSDENDCSDWGELGPESTGDDCYSRDEQLTPVSNLVHSISGIKDEASMVILSGIIGPDADQGCADAVPGKRYSTAIDKLGGFEGSICETDYSVMMDALGDIASGMRDAFPLEYVPDPSTIEVTVEPVGGVEAAVSEDATNGWTYNEDPTAPQILFHGAALPPRGAKIVVDYTIAGEIDDAG